MKDFSRRNSSCVRALLRQRAATHPTSQGAIRSQRSRQRARSYRKRPAEVDSRGLGVLAPVDDAVLADPDPPQVWIADQSPSTALSWVGAQRVDGLDNPASNLPVELELLLERPRIVFDGKTSSSAHSPSVRATSSAGIVWVRPASRLASRSNATRFTASEKSCRA